MPTYDTREPSDEERFDAFLALFEAGGDEEVAVLVYCGALPIPEPPTKH